MAYDTIYEDIQGVYMSLDFSTHRRKRSFPFPLFGMAAAAGMAALIFLFLIEGNDIIGLLAFDSSGPYAKPVAYTLMLGGFLAYMLGIGLISDIKADFKFLLHILQLSVFLFVFLTGYFIESEISSFFVKCLFVSLVAHNVFLIIFFLYQKKTSSSYGSRIMMLITTLKVLPSIYITVRIFSAGVMVFVKSSDLMDLIAKASLLILVFASVSVNSIYILYINRKVR